MLRMKLFLLTICCVYFSFCVLEGDAKSFGGKGTNRQYRQVKAHGYYNGKPDVYAREPPQGPVKKSRGPGISAWGIVAIILCIIFIAFAFYYFYLLYPIFCKKERRYNNIEMVV